MKIRSCLFLVVAAAIVVSCGEPTPTVPNDAELLARHSSLTPDLDALRKLLTAEPRVTFVSIDQIGIDCGEPRPAREVSGHFSSSEHDAYRRLLQRNGIKAVERRGDGAIEYWTYREGNRRQSGSHGPAAKGYLWSPREPERLFPSIDDPLNAETADMVFYRAHRRIAGDWYLEFKSGNEHRSRRGCVSDVAESSYRAG